MCLASTEVDGRHSFLVVEGGFSPKLCFVKFREERLALMRRQNNDVISAERNLFPALLLWEQNKLFSFSRPSFSHSQNGDGLGGS